MNAESLRLINAFLYSFVVSFSPIEAIFLLPLLMVLLYEKEFVWGIFKKLIVLNFFIIVLVAFVLFQNSLQAIELFMRTNLILLFNIALFYQSKGYDIARGLDRLGFAPKIVSVTYFALSLVDALMRDFKETQKSLKARGFRANTSLFTYQTYGNIFGMIVIKAIKKSHDRELSMQARGFKDRIFFVTSNQLELFEKILLLCIVGVLGKVVYELLG